MITAIITGAGHSKRFGGHKMLASIAGKPVLWHTLNAFKQSGVIDEYIVTARPEDIPAYKEILASHSIEGTIVPGGKERIQSLQNGIDAAKGDYIITHDGARPLTTPKLIRELVTAVITYGAAMTAVNPTATVKVAEKDMIIRRTLLRENTWIAQTPQGFQKDVLKEAVDKAVSSRYFIPTDDSEIVSEMTRHKIHIVPGEMGNIKITHPPDLAIAEQLLKEMRP